MLILITLSRKLVANLDMLRECVRLLVLLCTTMQFFLSVVILNSALNSHIAQYLVGGRGRLV